MSKTPLRNAPHGGEPTEPFSDHELLANGFTQVDRGFRKQVLPDHRNPLPETNVNKVQPVPMTIPPFEPRMGYGTTPQPVERRVGVLRDAEALITGDRNQSYGTPTQNFQNIAALWNIQFGHMLKPGMSFTGAHVAQGMAQVKLARMVAQPKRDNWVDLAGYAACGWEVQADEQ